MKKYWIIPGLSPCSYRLRWSDDTNYNNVPLRAKQITRREALRCAGRERAARSDEYSICGYADTCIFPADYMGETTHFDGSVFLEADRKDPRIINWSPDADRKLCNSRIDFLCCY